jgi:hypothetical protein
VTPSVDDLHDYVLDLLPDAERRRIDLAVARSPELSAEVRAMREALGMVGEVVGTAAPSAAARGRLLAALDAGARYAPFLRDLAQAFDLSLDRIRELFDEIDVPSAWEAGPFPGVSVMHFDSGPNVVAPDTGFVRLPAGTYFPYHEHLGPELNYVMEGALRDDDGSIYLPGEALIKSKEQGHELWVVEGADCLLAVVQDQPVFKPRPT